MSVAIEGGEGDSASLRLRGASAGLDERDSNRRDLVGVTCHGQTEGRKQPGARGALTRLLGLSARLGPHRYVPGGGLPVDSFVISS